MEKAKIGRAIMDADVFISLSHFKGHEQTGFGRCAEKYWHGVREPPGQDGAALRRKAGGEAEALRGCRQCIKQCGQDAISYDGGKAFIDRKVRGLRAVHRGV